MNENRIQMLKERMKDSSDDPFYIYALALEYKDFEPKKSLELLEESQKLFPDYLPVYFQLAELLVQFNQKDIALEVYRKGIELAKKQSENKTLAELQNAMQNLLFEED